VHESEGVKDTKKGTVQKEGIFRDKIKIKDCQISERIRLLEGIAEGRSRD
jgi:hypothetical protein